MSFFSLRLVYLQYLLQDWLISYSQKGNTVNIYVRPEHTNAALLLLKAHMSAHTDTLVDLVGIDCRATRNNRGNSNESTSGYKIVYTLLSTKYNSRLNVHTQISKELDHSTLTNIYPSAVWFEREVWDLLGIYFVGNPDMRRILSDYQFRGHALRKDYPLVGYVEAFFYDAEARVIYLPVRLIQEAKQFRVLKTWLN